MEVQQVGMGPECDRYGEKAVALVIKMTLWQNRQVDAI